MPLIIIPCYKNFTRKKLLKVNNNPAIIHIDLNNSRVKMYIHRKIEKEIEMYLSTPEILAIKELI